MADSKPDLATLVFKEEDLECSPLGEPWEYFSFLMFLVPLKRDTPEDLILLDSPTLVTDTLSVTAKRHGRGVRDEQEKYLFVVFGPFENGERSIDLFQKNDS